MAKAKEANLTSMAMLAALSKHICEAQADSIVRLFAGDPSTNAAGDLLRITTLRFHFTDPRRLVALGRATRRELWAHTSMRSACDAALLGLKPGPSSGGWQAGHEVFQIVGPSLVFGRESVEWVEESKGETRLPNDLPATGGWIGARHGAGTIDVDTPIEEVSRPGLYCQLANDGWDPDKGDARELFKVAYPDWQGEFRDGWWEADSRRGFYDASKVERLLGWRHVDEGE